MCGTRPGRKYVRFDKAVIAKVAVTEWEQECGKEGKDGGCMGETINYEHECDSIIHSDHYSDPLCHLVPAADDLNLATTLLHRMRIKATRLRPGKMIVKHSLPNELVRILLKPDWTYIDPVKYGLGYRRHFVIPPALEKFWVLYLAKIIAAHAAPMHWHLAQGFTVDKLNGKAGIKAERLVVAMCSIGRLVYEIFIDYPVHPAGGVHPTVAAIRQDMRAKQSVMPDNVGEWQFGCVKGRRREEAMAIQRIHSFELSKARALHDTIFLRRNQCFLCPRRNQSIYKKNIYISIYYNITIIFSAARRGQIVDLSVIGGQNERH